MPCVRTKPARAKFSASHSAAASPTASGHHSPSPCPSAPRYARPESRGCCSDSHRDLSKVEPAAQCTVAPKHTTGLIGCSALACACFSTFGQALTCLTRVHSKVSLLRLSELKIQVAAFRPHRNGAAAPWPRRRCENKAGTKFCGIDMPTISISLEGFTLSTVLGGFVATPHQRWWTH